MVRIVIISFLLFLFSINYCLAQLSQLEIFYKVKVYKKETNKKVSKTYELVFDEVSNIDLELLFNNNRSVFRKVNVLNIDARTKHIRKMTNLLTGIKGNYYFDLENEKLINEKEFDGVDYIINIQFPKFKWELTNESRLINGYLCYKATTINTYPSSSGITNLEVTAWYASELSIPIGPKVYGGLPGLILELHEGSVGEGRTYYASKIDLKPKRDIEILIPNEGEVVSQDEFHEITSKAFKILKSNVKE